MLDRGKYFYSGSERVNPRPLFYVSPKILKNSKTKGNRRKTMRKLLQPGNHAPHNKRNIYYGEYKNTDKPLRSNPMG